MIEDDPLLDALTAELRKRDDLPGTGGVFVTSYVAVASFTDDDGVSHVFTASPPDQRCHESLGLLDFAQAIERYRVVHPEEDQ